MSQPMGSQGFVASAVCEAAVPQTCAGRVAWAMQTIRLLGDQSAQALLEMALALPIFLLILFGTFEYSIVLFTYCNATYACRNAARYASLHSSASLAPSTVAQIQAMVTSGLYLNSTMTPTVTVSYVTSSLAASSNTVGNFVGVGVVWTQNVHVPFMSATSFSVGSQAYRLISR